MNRGYPRLNGVLKVQLRWNNWSVHKHLHVPPQKRINTLHTTLKPLWDMLWVLVLLKNHLFSFVSLHFQSSQHSGSSTSLASTKVCSSMDENDGPAEGNVRGLTFQSSRCSDNSSCVGNESFFLPEKVGAVQAGWLSARRLGSLGRAAQVRSGSHLIWTSLLRGVSVAGCSSSTGDPALAGLFHRCFVSSVTKPKSMQRFGVFAER